MRRYIRGVSKAKPAVAHRSPRIFLPGDSTAEHVQKVAINDETANMISNEGEADFVLLARNDYEQLIGLAEDRSATQAYGRTRQEEAVPLAIVDRLLAGENSLRVWREYRGLSLAELAGKTALSKGYLSDIENGNRTGTIETLKSIAAALDVDLEDVA
jgi:DNA-binding XRE family transcriptional regulator